MNKYLKELIDYLQSVRFWVIITFGVIPFLVVVSLIKYILS